jgi:hypothetical protein
VLFLVDVWLVFELDFWKEVYEFYSISGLSFYAFPDVGVDLMMLIFLAGRD